ncbi:MAG TPA: LemA family protein [candidate division Zixibacteria bacterium]|nr:LemA family protein [candidate division Zixibacteria bacterium]
MGLFFLIIILLFAVPIIWLVAGYNRLVRLRNGADRLWGRVKVILTKRADLIPNLVETVKGYAAHERGIFERVSESRSKFMAAPSTTEGVRQGLEFEKSLRSLLAVAENYPNLKANENFQALSNQLAGVESELAGARDGFNAGVLEYNNQLQTFPGNLVAGLFGFEKREFFELEEPAKAGAPKVEFKVS